MSTAVLRLFFMTFFVTVLAADDVGDGAVVEQLLSSISSKQPIKTETQISLLTTLKNSWESSDPKPAWGEKLKKAIKDLPPITPTIQNPIQATDWLRFQVRLETFARLNLFEAEDSFAHPASNDYPGEVPKGPNLEQMYNFTIPLEKDVAYSTLMQNQCPNAERVVQLNQTGKISCHKYCSSMLYAVAGSKLKITFPDDIRGFVVRIGHFEDDTSGLDSWRQYPNMRHVNSFVFPPSIDGATTNEVEMPIIFGGIVYIGQINSSITLDSMTFQMSGVVESPSYKFPDMNLLEWREERRVMTAPWGDLISPQLTISYPRRVLVKIEDPEELLIHWERMIDGINEVDATPYKGTRDHIGFARDLPESDTRIHAGWPIMAVENVGEDLVEFFQLWVKNSKMDAIFRALGQNHERHLSLLSLKKGNPLLPELFVDYIKNIVHGVTPHQTVKNEYKAENIVKVLGPYLKNGAKFEQIFSSGAATLFYFDIVRNFGWAMINKIANASRFSTVSGEDEKRNALITHVSQFQQENVAEYFKSWGIPFSKEVENGMNKLPKCDFTAKQLLDFANKQIKDAKKSTGRGFKKPKKTPPKVEKEEKKVLDHDEFPMESVTVPPVEGEAMLDEESEMPVEVKQQGRRMTPIHDTSPAEKEMEIEKRRSLWVRDTGATDLEQLLTKITEVKTTKSEGSQLVVFGENAFPVLAGRSSSSTIFNMDVPVVAAAKYGKGRMITISAETILLRESYEKTISGFPYFDQFRLNCLMWAGQYDAKNPNDFKPVIVRLTVKHNDRAYQQLADFLTATGFPTEQKIPYDFDLDKYNLVIIPYAHQLTTEFDNATKLEAFVKNGGGLIFYVAGRDYDQKGMANLPVNKLAHLAGISFTSEWSQWANRANGTFTSSRDILEQTVVSTAGKSLLGMEPTDSKMEAVMYTIRKFFQYANRSAAANFAWVKDIKKKFVNQVPLNPTRNTTIKKTDKLMARVLYEAFVMEYLFDANDRYAHPAAKLFPGSIPPKSDLSKVYSSTVTLDVDSVYDILTKEKSCQETVNFKKLYKSDSTKKSCQDWWCITHFYAPPGAKIIIKFTSPSNVVTSFSVSTGRFIEVTGPSQWSRYPLIKFEKTFYTNVGEFSSPFGGPLYIGDIVTPIGTTAVSYTISGVIESPHFFLGTTRLSDWTKRFSKSNAPWGIVSGQNIQIRLPLFALKLIKNPEELMLTWQHMIDGIDEFHILDYRTRRHILNYDFMLTNPSAFMISGKVQAWFSSSIKAVGMDYMWCNVGGDTHAYLHEFGHNLDLNWWKLNGGAEVTNNINWQYVMPTVFGKSKNNLFPTTTFEDASILQTLTKYEETGFDYNKFMSTGAGEVFFYDLHLNFGFNVFFKLAKLNHRTRDFIFESQRVDWVLVELSKILKRNMESYLNSWGMKPTTGAVDQVKDYPSTNYSLTDLFDQVKRHVEVRKKISNLSKAITEISKELKRVQENTHKINVDEKNRIRKRVDVFIKDCVSRREARKVTVRDKVYDYMANNQKETITLGNTAKQDMTSILDALNKGSIKADKAIEEIQKYLKTLESMVNARVSWVPLFVSQKTQEELDRFNDNQKPLEVRGMNETNNYILDAIAKYNKMFQGKDSALTKFFENSIPSFKKSMQDVEEGLATMAKKVSRPVQAGMNLVRDSRNILNQGKKVLQEVEKNITMILSEKGIEKIKADLTKEYETKWAEYRTEVKLSRNKLIAEFDTKSNQTITDAKLLANKIIKELKEFSAKKIKEVESVSEKLKPK